MNLMIRVMVVSACVWLATEFWFRTWGKMHEGDISLLLRVKQDPHGFANEHKVFVCVTYAQLIARPVCIGRSFSLRRSGFGIWGRDQKRREL